MNGMLRPEDARVDFLYGGSEGWGVEHEVRLGDCQFFFLFVLAADFSTALW
jgi:hypothetical protein